MPRGKVTFSKFKLDRAGVRKVLDTEFVEETGKAAQAMANNARSAMAHHPAEDGVTVEQHTSGERTYHEVTIRDARGIYYEVVHGVLTRAASAEGLDVKQTRSGSTT